MAKNDGKKLSDTAVKILGNLDRDIMNPIDTDTKLWYEAPLDETPGKAWTVRRTILTLFYGNGQIEDVVKLSQMSKIRRRISDVDIGEDAQVELFDHEIAFIRELADKMKKLPAACWEALEDALQIAETMTPPQAVTGPVLLPTPPPADPDKVA